MKQYSVECISGEVTQTPRVNGSRWCLSLKVKHNVTQREYTFGVADFPSTPKFDVHDVNSAEDIDTVFAEKFKKCFGDFQEIDTSLTDICLEKARFLEKKGQKDEAQKVIRDVALSLYHRAEYRKFEKLAKAHLAGVDVENFMAADYARVEIDPTVTQKDIIASMSEVEIPEIKAIPFPEIEARVNEVEDRIKELVPTVDKYRIRGEKNTAEYTPEREQLHIQILEKLIFENLERYIPQEGENPTFILLGGRGGSGKSKFEGLVYDDHFIVLDADKIKTMLPEYKGWNAAEVHEESSDILEQALLVCQRNGLNVVVDATMDTGLSAVRRLQLYKDKGYDTEAHYMFLPPQKSAQRAVTRFLKGGETGRYVPIDVLLSMRRNERNFDIIKAHVDAWSFYTSDVGYGEGAILLASGKQKKGYMEKSRSKYLSGMTDEEISAYPSKALESLSQRVRIQIQKVKGGKHEL